MNDSSVQRRLDFYPFGASPEEVLENYIPLIEFWTFAKVFPLIFKWKPMSPLWNKYRLDGSDQLSPYSFKYLFFSSFNHGLVILKKNKNKKLVFSTLIICFGFGFFTQTTEECLDLLKQIKHSLFGIANTSWNLVFLWWQLPRAGQAPRQICKFWHSLFYIM